MVVDEAENRARLPWVCCPTVNMRHLVGPTVQIEFGLQAKSICGTWCFSSKSNFMNSETIFASAGAYYLFVRAIKSNLDFAFFQIGCFFWSLRLPLGHMPNTRSQAITDGAAWEKGTRRVGTR